MKRVLFFIIVLIIGVFGIYLIINGGFTVINEEIPADIDVADAQNPVDDNYWCAPVKAGTPVSILNNLVGLIFSGPFEDVIEYVFYSHTPYIVIHNRAEYESGTDIKLLPVEFEYRLFRVTAMGDELLYSKPFPKFSGILPAGTFVSCSIKIPFWPHENIAPGTYKVQLVFPENFEYQLPEDDTVHYLSIRDNMYNEFYEFNVI